MKHIFRIIAVIVVLLVVVLLGASYFIDANQFRPMLEAQLTTALGRPVTVGNLSVAIWKGSVTADQLAIGDDPKFSRNPFLQAKSLNVAVDLWPLITSKKLNVTGLTIEQPEIVLVQAPSGVWNFSSLGSKTATPPVPSTPSSGSNLDLSARLVKITHGKVTLARTSSRWKPIVMQDVEVEVRDFSPASQFPFTLTAKAAGGGDLKLTGNAGPINMTDTSRTPVGANIELAKLDLGPSRVGQYMPGVAGLVSLTGKLTSDGRSVLTNGHVEADRLIVARNGSPAKRQVKLDFDATHNLDRQAGTLKSANIHLGSADAVLAGTFDLHEDTPLVNMRLSGPKMPIGELEAMLPAFGIVLPAGSSLQGGTAHVNITSIGPTDHLTTSGNLGLDNTKLVGFDLGGKIKTVAAIAGIKMSPDTDIQSLNADFHALADNVTVQNASLIVPTIGELTGAGDVTANHDLDFKMLAKLHTSGVMMAAIGQKGDTSIPFFVRGNASSPTFVPDAKGLVQAELKTAINSGTAAKAAAGLLDSLLSKKKKE